MLPESKRGSQQQECMASHCQALVRRKGAGERYYSVVALRIYKNMWHTNLEAFVFTKPSVGGWVCG